MVIATCSHSVRGRSFVFEQQGLWLKSLPSLASPLPAAPFQPPCFQGECDPQMLEFKKLIKSVGQGGQGGAPQSPRLEHVQQSHFGYRPHVDLMLKSTTSRRKLCEHMRRWYYCNGKSPVSTKFAPIFRLQKHKLLSLFHYVSLSSLWGRRG